MPSFVTDDSIDIRCVENRRPVLIFAMCFFGHQADGRGKWLSGMLDRDNWIAPYQPFPNDLRAGSGRSMVYLRRQLNVQLQAITERQAPKPSLLLVHFGGTTLPLPKIGHRRLLQPIRPSWLPAAP